MNEHGPWHGLSLRFVRMLLGQPGRHATADDAREASGPLRDGVPPTGGICWYKSKYGNVALSIGEVDIGGTWVVCVSNDGWPRLRHYTEEELGEYLGWTERIGAAE